MTITDVGHITAEPVSAPARSTGLQAWGARAARRHRAAQPPRPPCQQLALRPLTQGMEAPGWWWLNPGFARKPAASLG